MSTECVLSKGEYKMEANTKNIRLKQLRKESKITQEQLANDDYKIGKWNKEFKCIINRKDMQLVWMFRYLFIGRR